MTQRPRKMINSIFTSNIEVLSNSSTRQVETDKKQREDDRVKIRIKDIGSDDYTSSPGTFKEYYPVDSGRNNARLLKFDIFKGPRTTRNFNQSVNVINTFEKLPQRKLRQQYKKTFNFNQEIYTPRKNTIKILEFDRLQNLPSERRLSGSPKLLEQTQQPRKKTKVIAGHAMSIRDNRIGPSQDHYLYSTDITEKDFGANDNEGHDSALWKNREMDWYNAERRFIFATKTQAKCEKLIKLISKESTEPLRLSKSKRNQVPNQIIAKPSQASPASGQVNSTHAHSQGKFISYIPKQQNHDYKYIPVETINLGYSNQSVKEANPLIKSKKRGIKKRNYQK